MRYIFASPGLASRRCRPVTSNVRRHKHHGLVRYRMKPPANPLQALGFPELTEVVGLRSIAHLFGTSARRCGIYALLLPGDRYYIGQAIDVVRRYAQHAKAREEISGFTFLAIPKASLDKRERELIFEAERAKLTLVNVVHVTDVEGESDLDVLLTPQKLASWLTDPFIQNEDDFDANPVALSPGQIARFDQNFKKFKGHPLYGQATLLLFLYLESAVPYPRTTEYSFWSVSCMPSTNQSKAPRLLCVNMSVMEVFVLGYHKDPKFEGFGWAFANVASDVLFSEYGDEQKFKKAHPDVEVRPAGYRDAGQYCVGLMVYLLDDMLKLLGDKAVARAAATMCLRLMRKRATIYSKFHCPQLVDHALSLRALQQEELDAVFDAAFPPEEDEQDGNPPVGQTGGSSKSGLPRGGA